MALYSEHQAVPEEAKLTLTSGQESVRMAVERPALTREVETEVIMTARVAAALRECIDQRLDALEAIQKKAEKPETS